MNITPSAATAFNVIGGNPSSGADGDVVVMNTADIAGRKFTYLGRNAGRWDFDGRRSLLFSEVELVSSGS